MSNGSPLEQVAGIHQHAFEHADRHMQPDRLATFTGWVATHPEYTPTFSTRLGASMEWSKQNSEKFSLMVADFDAALDFLNTSETPVDEAVFANIDAYRKHRKGTLPKVGGQDVHNASQILAAARNSGSRLRWGETIKPEDGNYYGFHTFVKSDQGMAAASLTDLYENYTRTLGLYPDDANIDAIVANAITEAAYLTNPSSELFQTYKNPDDEWIYGYDGFSPQFQQAVYGKPHESDVSPESTATFFALMKTRLAEVPELQPALDLAVANPERTQQVFETYVAIIDKLSRLTDEEKMYISSSSNNLMSSRSGANSASKKNALDILTRLSPEDTASLAGAARDAINPSSEYFEAAMHDFALRTEGGHNLKVSGKTPIDGDPASDTVIWGHTQIVEPETLLHFATSHYLERYFSQVLASMGVEFAANQKDYFLNALTDVIMLDHFSENHFADVFEVWAVPRDQGGLGWIKADRIQAYTPKSDK